MINDSNNNHDSNNNFNSNGVLTIIVNDRDSLDTQSYQVVRAGLSDLSRMRAGIEAGGTASTSGPPPNSQRHRPHADFTQLQ